jgi:hypothetical protein
MLRNLVKFHAEGIDADDENTIDEVSAHSLPYPLLSNRSTHCLTHQSLINQLQQSREMHGLLLEMLQVYAKNVQQDDYSSCVTGEEPRGGFEDAIEPDHGHFGVRSRLRRVFRHH